MMNILKARAFFTNVNCTYPMGCYENRFPPDPLEIMNSSAHLQVRCGSKLRNGLQNKACILPLEGQSDTRYEQSSALDKQTTWTHREKIADWLE